VLLVLVSLVTTITRQHRPFIQAEICNFIPVIFCNLPPMMTFVGVDKRYHMRYI